MTPTHAIRMLDRQLAKHGQDVTIKLTGGDVVVRAFVRGMKPDELTGDLSQNDRKVTLSPTGLPSLPQRLDTLTTEEREHMIEFQPDVVRMNNVPVRINLVVRG